MHTKTFCTWSASILYRTKAKFSSTQAKINVELNYVWTNGANWYEFSCVGSNVTQIHVNRARKHYDRNYPLTFYMSWSGPIKPVKHTLWLPDPNRISHLTVRARLYILKIIFWFLSFRGLKEYCCICKAFI